jgi:hypothetical protein
LIAGANFALGWIQKRHPRLNFVTMSLSLPSPRGSVALRVHMDATLQPTRRIIARLLEATLVSFASIITWIHFALIHRTKWLCSLKIVTCFCYGFPSVRVVTVLILLPESLYSRRNFVIRAFCPQFL